MSVERLRTNGPIDLRALKEGYEEASYVQCNRVEQHDSAKPLV